MKFAEDTGVAELCTFTGRVDDKERVACCPQPTPSARWLSLSPAFSMTSHAEQRWVPPVGSA